MDTEQSIKSFQPKKKDKLINYPLGIPFNHFVKNFLPLLWFNNNNFLRIFNSVDFFQLWLHREILKIWSNFWLEIRR